MKSFYEMTDEERSQLSPGDFTDAYIKESEQLVDEWAKTPYLEPPGHSIPGKDERERDLNRARYSRIFQNYIDAQWKPTKNVTPGDHISVAEAMQRIDKLLKEAGDPFGEMNIVETASAAQTTAWSGATTIPLVLGYVRKLLPKLYGMQFYQVQPLDRPTGRVFFIARNRDTNGTTDGQVAQRAGWSYRSWINDPGENTAITNAVTFTITSSDVSAKSRKLQAQTTIEVEQDLRAYFGLDAVSLVSDIATDEMAIEIDEELIYALYNHAVANGVGQFQYGLNGVPTGETSESYQKKIIETFNRAGFALWHQRRVLPNYAIMGTDFTTLLTNLALWRTNTNELTFDSFLMPGVNIPVVGNPVGYSAAKPWPTSEAILGHKGTDYVDGTAFFLPYLPLQLTGVLYDPNTMHRTLSWISRYTTYFNKFTGQKESFAWLTTSASLVGTSYAAPVEYV